MNWGLIGASTIAAQYMIDAIRAQQGHEIVSVLSSSTERGSAYAVKRRVSVSFLNVAHILLRKCHLLPSQSG